MELKQQDISKGMMMDPLSHTTDIVFGTTDAVVDMSSHQIKAKTVGSRQNQQINHPSLV